MTSHKPQMRHHKLSLIQQKIILVLLLSLLLDATGWSLTYYVDATRGSDQNGGLAPASAWRTISRVNGSHFNPGDSVLFKRGETWREELIVPSSGADANPITFGAYGAGEKPVISGADLVNVWLPDETYINVWTAPFINQPALLIINGSLAKKRAIRAQLKSIGDWSWEAGYIYLYAESNPSTNGYTIEAANRKSCFSGNTKHYIVVDSLCLLGSNERTLLDNKGDYWVISNNTITNTSGDNGGSGAIAISFGTGVIVQYNTIAHTLNDGIYAYSSIGLIVNENTISDSNGPNADNIQIDYGKNCQVHANDCDQRLASSSTKGNIITQMGSDSIIEKNNCIFGNYGLSIGDIRAKIGYNYSAHHLSAEWSWGFAVNVDNCCNSNQTWYYNISNDDKRGFWIESGNRINLYNNVVYGTQSTSQGLLIASLNTGELRNNIIWCPAAHTVFQLATPVGIIASENNDIGPEMVNFLYYGGHCFSSFTEYKSWSGQDSSSLSLDPKFVDPVTEDFNLKLDSPCIEAGTYMGFSSDFYGNTVQRKDKVNMGASETFRMPAPKKVHLLIR